MGILGEGALVGLAGAAAVAAWFFVADALAGTPFRTPNLLGAVLFEGARTAEDVHESAGLVLAYTAVHFAIFGVFGTLLAALMTLADREARVLFVVWVLLCCFVVFVAAAVAALAGWLLDPIPAWSLIGANLFAAAAMLGVIWPRHPVTWRAYTESD